jgi:hypothetical protein
MVRLWFVILLAGAVVAQYTPGAFATGCEGGASSAGHNAIEMCCNHEGGRQNPKHNTGRVIGTGSGLRAT